MTPTVSKMQANGQAFFKVKYGVAAGSINMKQITPKAK